MNPMPLAWMTSMEHRPRAVVLDLDGTTLDSRSVLRPRTESAIDAVLDAGIPVVIATARALRSASALLGPSLIPRVRIVHLGGAVIHDGGNLRVPLAHRAIGPEHVRAALRAAERLLPEARIVVEYEGWELGSNQVMPRDLLWTTNRATPDMVSPIDLERRRPVTKIAVRAQTPVEPFVQEIEGTQAGRLAVERDRFDVQFVQIVAAGVSKETGVVRALGAMSPGIGLSECLAIGDDLSDLPLLQAVRYGVAMGNAHPQVLAGTEHSTRGNDEDGVALVLEQLVRIAARA